MFDFLLNIGKGRRLSNDMTRTSAYYIYLDNCTHFAYLKISDAPVSTVLSRIPFFLQKSGFLSQFQSLKMILSQLDDLGSEA